MNKQYLWIESDLLYRRLIRLSTEAYQACLHATQTTKNKMQAMNSYRLGRLAIRGGERALRRQKAVVQEQEEHTGICDE